VIHYYFGYKIADFQRIIDSASRIKEMSIKLTSLIYFTDRIF
jgi:hypothetical protein